MEKQKCPVCDWDIDDNGRDVEVKDKTITVCCEDCEKKLLANPEKYMVRYE